MDIPNGTQVNDRLRQERIGRNWRQRDLAEQLGTTVVTVKRWERGYQQPSPYFLVKLCAIFGKSAAELGLSEGNPLPSVDASGATQPSSTEALALWTIPYPRNPHFTGRDELLDHLGRHLTFEKPGDATTLRRAVLSQPQAVKGLGGIGKTQLAIEYAYRAREQDRYTHTLWINAASEEAILTSFQMLAEQLPRFVDKDEKDQRKLIAAILRWLETCQESWLLIFDNADELSLVQSYLPGQGRGSILLTTRTTAVGWLAKSLEVEQMGLMEGTQFLLHRAQCLTASDEERNEATNIVIALDGFPLALDQAGAYIEETGCSFGDYLQIYEQHRARLLARRGKQANNYPYSVATTWSLSFEKIEQAYPAAAELLRLCAYLSPDHIPEELLTQGATYWPGILQEAMIDPLSFNEQLEALLAFSLVKRMVQERQLSLHRLVQVVQRDRMDEEQQLRWAERVVRAVNTLFPANPQDEIDTWPLCLRYLEQAQACDQLIQQHHLQLPEAADLLDRAGLYLLEHASYGQAEPLFQRALAIAEQQLGLEHLQVASSLNNLGQLYFWQGKYELAEPLFQRAVRIREQVLGQEHLLVSYPLLNLGNLYIYQGKYELAEPLYQRTLHIREQALGPQHPLVAFPLNNLGFLYKKMGLYKQAESQLQQALLITEQALGPHHLQLTMILDSLGDLYYEQGKYGLAEPLYQRALAIHEQVQGPNHLQVAFSLTGLANLSREQGLYEQANALYQRTLSLRQEHLGQEHIEIAETLLDLARLREMQQQLTEALSLYQRTLAIHEQVLGAEHSKTTEIRKRLCAVLQALGKIEEAAALEALLDPAKREDEQTREEH